MSSPNTRPSALAAEAAPVYRRRVFYGWWIVAANVAILALVSGTGFYGLGVFLPALEREFQTSPTMISLGTTVFFLIIGLAGPFVGRRIDLLGPRLVMVAGNILFGLGLLSLSFARELWQMYLSYAVLALGSTAGGLLPATTLVATWFRARRGLAMGVTLLGLSTGGVIMTPLATSLLLALGWRAAFGVLAVLAWTVCVPLSALVIRRRPEDLGLEPDGAAPPRLRPAGPREHAVPAWTLSAARRTWAFWAVAIGFLLIYVGQIGVLIHEIRFLTYGDPAEGAISPEEAAIAVSLTALASICGRLALGTVVDRFDTRWVAVGAILLEAVAMIGLLPARGNLVLVYLAVLGLGLGMGWVLMLQSLLVSDLFGVTSYGAILGAINLVTTVGTAGGPWLAGLLFDAFGSYTVAFVVFGLLGFLAAGIVALARPPAGEGSRQ